MIKKYNKHTGKFEIQEKQNITNNDEKLIDYLENFINTFDPYFFTKYKKDEFVKNFKKRFIAMTQKINRYKLLKNRNSSELIEKTIRDIKSEYYYFKADKELVEEKIKKFKDASFKKNETKKDKQIYYGHEHYGSIISVNKENKI